MSRLNNIELNVLAVALDHMEEHLREVESDGWGSGIENVVTQGRLEALKTIRTKLL